MSETKFTPGPWHPPHLCDPATQCNCTSVVDEGYAGGICTIHFDNGLLVGDGGNDAPPRSEAIFNAFLIAAAPDLFHELLTSPCPHPIGDDYSVDDCLKSGNCGCGSGAAIRKARGELS